MKYKILAADLDGTLNNSAHFISEGNKSAILKAVNEGLTFVICSGRSPHSINRFEKSIGLTKEGCYGIGFNGSCIYQSNTMETLHEHRLDKENTLKVIRAVKKASPNIPLIVYMENNLIYCEEKTADIEKYRILSNIHTQVVESFENSITSDVMKLIIRSEPAALKELYEHISTETEGLCDMFFSDAHLLEFAPIGSNKSSGLQYLAGYLGVSMDEVIAVGDNYNDYEMVKDAGFGVAVSNAVDKLKEVAKYVTIADNDNDAIKEIIERFCLEDDLP